MNGLIKTSCSVQYPDRKVRDLFSKSAYRKARYVDRGIKRRGGQRCFLVACGLVTLLRSWRERSATQWTLRCWSIQRMMTAGVRRSVCSLCWARVSQVQSGTSPSATASWIRKVSSSKDARKFTSHTQCFRSAIRRLVRLTPSSVVEAISSSLLGAPTDLHQFVLSESLALLIKLSEHPFLFVQTICAQEEGE